MSNSSLTMKSMRSKCIVCCDEFPVSRIVERSNSKSFRNNFRLFCSYLNILPRSVNEGEDEEVSKMWDCSCESFSFCKECKISIESLYKFHHQQIAIKKDIRKVVSGLVKKIVTTETANNNNNSSMMRDDQSNEKENTGTASSSSILNSTNQDNEILLLLDNSNRFNAQKKLVVKDIVADRIQNVKQTIWTHYTPNVIIDDCKELIEQQQQKNQIATVEIVIPDLNSLKESQPSSSSQRQQQVENYPTLTLVSNVVEQEDDNSIGLNTTEESVHNNDDGDDELENSNNADSQIVNHDPQTEVVTQKIRVSKRKRSLPDKLKDDAWEDGGVDDQGEDDANDNADDECMSDFDVDELLDCTSAADIGGGPSNATMRKKPKLQADIGSKLFSITTVEKGVFQYGNWKIIEVVKNRKYKCQECNHTNVRRSAIIKHINNTHIMNIEGYSKITMDDNGIFHYKEWSFEKVESGFKCLDCGRVRKNKHSLANHINEIHNKSTLRLNCDKCGKTYSSTAGLANHKCCPKKRAKKVKNVNLGGGKYVYDGIWTYKKFEGVGFQCGTCSVYKSSIDRMSAHIRERHIDPNKYICDICGYAVGNPSVMKQHMKCHTEVRDVVCDVCGKFFKSLGRLSAHKKGHREERYHCGVCGKSFQYQNGLGRHRRLTGHQPAKIPRQVSYDCSKCERDLRTQKRLEKHVLKCIGKKDTVDPPFVCSVCGHLTLDENQMRNHMTVVHDMQQDDDDDVTVTKLKEEVDSDEASEEEEEEEEEDDDDEEEYSDTKVMEETTDKLDNNVTETRDGGTVTTREQGQGEGNNVGIYDVRHITMENHDTLKLDGEPMEQHTVEALMEAVGLPQNVIPQ